MNYIISFDLHKPGQNHAEMKKELKSLDAIPVLRTTWLLKTDKSAITITSHLESLMDENDELVVFGLSQQYSSFGLEKGTDLFINNFISER